MKELSPQHCVSANSLFSTFVSPSGIWCESMSEAAVQRCSYEKVFWKYETNLQENTHAEKWISIKLQSNFIEITLQHGCSPANLLHLFRTRFLENTSGQLLLQKLTNQIYDNELEIAPSNCAEGAFKVMMEFYAKLVNKKTSWKHLFF